MPKQLEIADYIGLATMVATFGLMLAFLL